MWPGAHVQCGEPHTFPRGCKPESPSPCDGCGGGATATSKPRGIGWSSKRGFKRGRDSQGVSPGFATVVHRCEAPAVGGWKECVAIGTVSTPPSETVHKDDPEECLPPSGEGGLGGRPPSLFWPWDVPGEATLLGTRVSKRVPSGPCGDARADAVSKAVQEHGQGGVTGIPAGELYALSRRNLGVFNTPPLGILDVCHGSLALGRRFAARSMQCPL